MGQRLQGKTAVVTGAGSGIGRVIAERFCQEGARVLAADLSGRQNELAEKLGSSCVPFQVDVSKGVEVQAMFAAARVNFGKLDILCNNAGIKGRLALTEDYVEEDFDRVWNINGRSIYLGMHYGLPLLRANGGGSIINLGSMASVVAASHMIAYCGAKGAIRMMTKVTAVEYASQGIRANCICPGTIASELLSRLPQRTIQQMVDNSPMGRLGQPEEVAALALFLASDESSFITGSEIMIDGGITAI